MKREDFDIGWKALYGIAAVIDVIIYFQARGFWLSQLFSFLTFLLFIFLLIDLFILKNWKDIYFFFLILAITICWYFSFRIQLTQNALASHAPNYIFSSISQGLAALFALVFTISLVAAQMSVKYSARMIRRFFKWYIILYMMLFVGGIIFPLIGMKIGKEWSVNVSIGLAGTCSILLISYYLDFRNKLYPNRFLAELASDAKSKFSKYDVHDIRWLFDDERIIIDNVIMTSYINKDYETFEIGLIELLGIAFDIKNDMIIDNIFESYNSYIEISKGDNRGITILKRNLKIIAEMDILRKSSELARGITNSLEMIASKNIEEPHIVQDISSTLRAIGFRSILSQNKEYFELSTDMLVTIFYEAIRSESDTSLIAIDHIGLFGDGIVIEKSDEELKYLVKKLEKMLEFTDSRDLSRDSSKIIDWLKSIERRSNELNYDFGKELIDEIKRKRSWI